jgi:hypothetical protein
MKLTHEAQEIVHTDVSDKDNIYSRDLFGGD